MRIFIVFILLSLFLASYGQTPDYFANDPKWVCGFYNSNQWNPPYIASTSTSVTFICGDTTISGNIYHRLYFRSETVYNGPIPTSNHEGYTNTFLRQEGKSIRFYNIDTGVDSLLVSYDYNIGDTIKGYVFQGTPFTYDTIQKIDSVLINTEYRKVFYLDSISGPVITEGIGHQIYSSADIGGFLSQMNPGIGFNNLIYCFGFGNTTYWDPYGTGGNCYLNVDVEETETSEAGVFPNPFSSYLNIHSIPGSGSEIILCDVSGREVLRKSFVFEIQIPTSDFENGLHLYEIRCENRVIKHGKVMKAGE